MHIRFLIALVLIGRVAAGGAVPSVLQPRFSLPTPEPVIRKAVQSTKFAEAVGRRSALLGREDGTFEAWINPIKVLRDFQLSAYFDDSMEGVPLSTLAETISASPGRTTITHAHSAFTIRQTWFAPLDKPVLVVLLDIDTARPLRLRATFVPEMRPMWPASFGAQTFAWSAPDHIFVEGEGTHRFAAVVGSPMFSRGSSAAAGAILEMDVTPELARGHLIPIVITASSAGEDGARKLYADTLGSVQDLITESDAYYRDFQAKTMRIHTPEATLDQAFEWAKFALEKGWTCNDRIGCELVGGFGPSGSGDRPGRDWYFGADALIDSWSIVDYGDLDRARAILEFLRERQRADGKILDQLTQSANLVDWAAYPFGYVRGDTTPLYLFAAARYVVRSGDSAFLHAIWPSLEKAYRFCVSTSDADGLMTNHGAGPAAWGADSLGPRLAKDTYLEGTWLAALDGYAILADLDHHADEAQRARQKLQAARKSLDSWFHDDRGYFSFATLTDGRTFDAQSSWQALALVYGGIDGAKADKASAGFAGAQLTLPWGTRLFAGSGDTSVWPLATGLVTLAEFRNHRTRAAIEHLHSIASLSGFSGAGFLPEDLSGDRAQTMPQSVPHALLSSASVIHPVVRGLLGLGGDAFDGTFSFVPHLPAHWPSLRFEMYRIGQSWVSGEVEHQTGMLHIRLTVIGKPLKIYLAPALPRGTTMKTVKVNGKKAVVQLETSDLDVHPVLETPTPVMGLDVVYQLREGAEPRPDLPVFEVGESATQKR